MQGQGSGTVPNKGKQGSGEKQTVSATARSCYLKDGSLTSKVEEQVGASAGDVEKVNATQELTLRNC